MQEETALDLSASLVLVVVPASFPRWTLKLWGRPVCGLPRPELSDHGCIVRVYVGTGDSQAKVWEQAQMETAGSNLPVAVLFTLLIRVSPTLYQHALTLLEVGDMALAATPGFKHGSQLE